MSTTGCAPCGPLEEFIRLDDLRSVREGGVGDGPVGGDNGGVPLAAEAHEPGLDDRVGGLMPRCVQNGKGAFIAREGLAEAGTLAVDDEVGLDALGVMENSNRFDETLETGLQATLVKPCAAGTVPHEDIAGVDEKETIHGFRIDFDRISCFLEREMQLENRKVIRRRTEHA